MFRIQKPNGWCFIGYSCSWNIESNGTYCSGVGANKTIGVILYYKITAVFYILIQFCILIWKITVNIIRSHASKDRIELSQVICVDVFFTDYCNIITHQLKRGQHFVASAFNITDLLAIYFYVVQNNLYGVVIEVIHIGYVIVVDMAQRTIFRRVAIMWNNNQRFIQLPFDRVGEFILNGSCINKRLTIYWYFERGGKCRIRFSLANKLLVVHHIKALLHFILQPVRLRHRLISRHNEAWWIIVIFVFDSTDIKYRILSFNAYFRKFYRCAFLVIKNNTQLKRISLFRKCIPAISFHPKSWCSSYNFLQFS